MHKKNNDPIYWVLFLNLSDKNKDMVVQQLLANGLCHISESQIREILCELNPHVMKALNRAYYFFLPKEVPALNMAFNNLEFEFGHFKL